MVHLIWLPVNIISGETSDECEKEAVNGAYHIMKTFERQIDFNRNGGSFTVKTATPMIPR